MRNAVVPIRVPSGRNPTAASDSSAVGVGIRDASSVGQCCCVRAGCHVRPSAYGDVLCCHATGVLVCWHVVQWREGGIARWHTHGATMHGMQQGLPCVMRVWRRGVDECGGMRGHTAVIGLGWTGCLRGIGKAKHTGVVGHGAGHGRGGGRRRGRQLRAGRGDVLDLVVVVIGRHVQLLRIAGSKGGASSRMGRLPANVTGRGVRCKRRPIASRVSWGDRGGGVGVCEAWQSPLHGPLCCCCLLGGLAPLGEEREDVGGHVLYSGQLLG